MRAAGMRAFPPRLSWQPTFYPVLNETYATEIARDWNTKDAASGYVGYVTRFEVRADFLVPYEAKVVGARSRPARRRAAVAARKYAFGTQGGLTMDERDYRKPKSVFGYEEGLFEIERQQRGVYRYACRRCGWQYEARTHAEVAPHPCSPTPK